MIIQLLNKSLSVFDYIKKVRKSYVRGPPVPKYKSVSLALVIFYHYVTLALLYKW